MTTKQKAAISAAQYVLEQLAEKLANEPARAKSEALKSPSPLGTAPFEAGWLGSSCTGAAREVQAAKKIIADAFPNVPALFGKAA